MTADDYTRRMVCGGLAGMIAKTATNPLERIKMLSQTGETANAAAAIRTERPSILGIYRQILHNEGVRGLWAGNGANLIRVFPSKAVVFSSHDFYRKVFGKYFVKHDNHNDKLPAHYSFLAGGLAGMTATAVTYPLDLARGRISGKMAAAALSATSSGSSGGQKNMQKAYTGIWQTLTTTVKDEGARGLYKGVTPTLLGAMPYVGIQFGTVGLLEKLFPLEQKQDSSSSGSSSSSTGSTPLRKMVFGGLGGMTAGLLTFPNDTVRRLMQLQGSRGTTARYTGYWDCVRQIVRHEGGVARLYRGMTVNLIRMAPNTAVQFGSYELLKQWTSTK